jgi:heterodisulfide reductase subunit B
VLEDAHAHGADVIATVCPLCDMNLDTRQVQIKNLGFEMPILYAPQLMAMAFGLDKRATLLNKCVVDPRPILREKGFAV